MTDDLPGIIIGVPGPWRDNDEVFSRLVKVGQGRYIAAEAPEEEIGCRGMVGLMDQRTNWFCACELIPRRPDIEHGVVLMGFQRLGPRSTHELAAHRSILMMRSQGGSEENARAMKNAADAAMRCGGLAVIIESTGVAHSPQDWRQLTANDDWGSLYWTYITTIGPKGSTCYTCGLHNLGLRDAITDIFRDPHEAAWVMHNFLGYAYQSGHPVVSGDAFGDDNGAMFKALQEPCRHIHPDDPFYNPYGMWRIVPLPKSERKNLKPNPFT